MSECMNMCECENLFMKMCENTRAKMNVSVCVRVCEHVGVGAETLTVSSFSGPGSWAFPALRALGQVGQEATRCL